MLNVIVVVIAAVVLLFMFHPRLTRSRAWQATLTPLSSIIGSGFLIVAPLHSSVVGTYAPLAVTGIVLLAYAIGSVMRFNIMHAEPLLYEREANPLIYKIDLIANAALSFAYVTAVAFYLSLLSSFLLTYLGFENALTMERALTTIIIVFIAATGYLRGLGGLEKLEGYAMSVQLSIVAALMVGIMVYDYHFLQSEQTLVLDVEERGVLDPGIDSALFSLAADSPSLAKYGYSAADIFYTEFTGGFGVYAEAELLGLDPIMDVNALEVQPGIPEPISMTLLGLGLVGLAMRRYRK